MLSAIINNYKVNGFSSKKDLLKQVINKKKILIAMNAEKILQEDDRLVSIVNENIAYPDGVGAVMALNKKGIKTVKIPGSELWLDIINEFNREKTFYFIGSTSCVIEAMIIKIKKEYPAITIAGYRDGYMNSYDKKKLIDSLKKTRPDVVFVAQGSPKQEFLMSQLIKEYPALYMGLGGSFDLYVGSAKVVPDWWKKIFKWEGLYRCLNDFQNVDRWKRQPKVFIFLFRMLFNKL